MDTAYSGAEILIVEDDPAIQQALWELLADEGYRVTAVAHGQDALAYLRTAQPHPRLILLDLLMPIMNGYTFRAVQQQEAQLAQIPVVVLSAQRLTPEVAADLQVAFYLRKPIAVPQLLSIVASYCQ